MYKIINAENHVYDFRHFYIEYRLLRQVCPYEMFTVTDVYSHIIDEDRCKNAQKLQNTFYSDNKADEKENQLSDKSKMLIELLSKSPELADKLLQSIGQLS